MKWLVIAATLTASCLWGQVPQKPPDNPIPPFFKGDRDKDEDPNSRSVSGVVKDASDAFVDGAVVKLKDTKTLQVRSFITKTDGKYRFGGMRKDVDYELKADHQGRSSETKTVSVFDSRKAVLINLKLTEQK